MLFLSAMALDIVEPSIDDQQTIIETYENDTLKLPNGPIDWSWSIEQCLTWHRPNHLYFQLGNALFLIAFLAPRGPFSVLCARCALVLGSILMLMWGYMIQCTGDVILWSAAFLVVNVIYLIYLLCRFRPIRFDKEIEAVSDAI